MAVLAGLANHHLAIVGPGRHKVVRTYGRRCGLLLTRTDSCTITVVEGPTGAIVTTVGSLVPVAYRALDSALKALPPPAPVESGGVATPAPAVVAPPAAKPQPPTPPPSSSPPSAPASTPPQSKASVAASPPVSPAPRVSPPPEDDATQGRGPHSAPTRVPSQGPARAPAVVLRLGNGQTFDLSAGVIVIGRDPVGLPSDRSPRLVAVSDPGRTISKSHFACWQDERGVFVQDRHSTNGTGVRDRYGRSAQLVPGLATRVPEQVTVMFGSSAAEIAPA